MVWPQPTQPVDRFREEMGVGAKVGAKFATPPIRGRGAVKGAKITNN